LLISATAPSIVAICPVTTLGMKPNPETSRVKAAAVAQATGEASSAVMRRRATDRTPEGLAATFGADPLVLACGA
jgi:hypothetical protein